MKIDLHGKPPEMPDASRPTKSGSQAAAKSSREETGATDRAELSQDQARVRHLAAEVHRLPEMRQERVAALQRAIRDDSYSVSAEQAAEAMMSEMLARSSRIR
jgi:flagellar biosynthesis anti-sigma factor FlgM